MTKVFKMSLLKKVDVNGQKGARESPCYFCNELFEMGQLQVKLGS